MPGKRTKNSDGKGSQGTRPDRRRGVSATPESKLEAVDEARVKDKQRTLADRVETLEGQLTKLKEQLLQQKEQLLQQKEKHLQQMRDTNLQLHLLQTKTDNVDNNINDQSPSWKRSFQDGLKQIQGETKESLKKLTNSTAAKTFIETTKSTMQTAGKAAAKVSSLAADAAPSIAVVAALCSGPALLFLAPLLGAAKEVNNTQFANRIKTAIKDYAGKVLENQLTARLVNQSKIFSIINDNARPDNGNDTEMCGRQLNHLFEHFGDEEKGKELRNSVMLLEGMAQLTHTAYRDLTLAELGEKIENYLTLATESLREIAKTKKSLSTDEIQKTLEGKIKDKLKTSLSKESNSGENPEDLSNEILDAVASSLASKIISEAKALVTKSQPSHEDGEEKEADAENESAAEPSDIINSALTYLKDGPLNVINRINSVVGNRDESKLVSMGRGAGNDDTTYAAREDTREYSRGTNARGGVSAVTFSSSPQRKRQASIFSSRTTEADSDPGVKNSDSSFSTANPPNLSPEDRNEIAQTAALITMLISYKGKKEKEASTCFSLSAIWHCCSSYKWSSNKLAAATKLSDLQQQMPANDNVKISLTKTDIKAMTQPRSNLRGIAQKMFTEEDLSSLEKDTNGAWMTKDKSGQYVILDNSDRSDHTSTTSTTSTGMPGPTT